ncbi:hypothetical protein Ptr902_07306 [Pyrenophora tritici-repentis]|nr:hypothetical protein PtrV1_13793 [Pyrenophora tritici-repentis]KAI0569286.1 hypothetical protein Alg130_11706 [Pyrenophora tritici-repentis]KAI0570896.1 hypothetical protein Alg215_10765 [Pyrenophora tritici-repentis]KAI0604793.1 hypothetical protein TUN205_10958 [Pyrenophora tritici-repentis]KAI0616361.1 hypothetical protein TUN199_11646 [Pyrenophora tritici-repentis]
MSWVAINVFRLLAELGMSLDAGVKTGERICLDVVGRSIALVLKGNNDN